MLRELAQPQGIPPGDILIGGDEFGPLAGVAGSDAKLMTPEARESVFISVGREPGGVPPEVIALGGGPARFRTLLACQVALWEQRAQGGHRDPVGAEVPLAFPITPTADPDWLLREEGFNLAREHEIESLFTVANGSIGTRGSLAEGSALSAPATFVAGVFAVRPQSDAIPELAVAPDWMRLRGVINGQALTLEEGIPLEHRRVLDLRQGLLWREWRHRDPSGRVTRVRGLRLASLADRHVLLQAVVCTPENYSGRLLLESRVEPPEDPNGLYTAAWSELLPVPSATGPPGSVTPTAGTVALALRTADTGITVAFATVSQVRTEAGERLVPEVETGDGWFAERWDADVEIGRTYRLDRLVVVSTSRATAQPTEVAARRLERLLAAGGDRVIQEHVQAWAARWRAAEVEVEGDPDAQRALRFALYHLISAANPEDERASIGARALTGAAYMGHVFWDTEIYLLPFFVFTDPPAARALLMYRYHTLPAAREKARALGYRGALYAWESADRGEETTPPLVVIPDGEVVRILTGEQEHHIAADIAYAVWHYWQATGDETFLLNAGAEILLETARFWASRGRMEADGRYHLRQSIGPDEYHEDVDDNAYTNVMAQWSLERGAETARLLSERWPQHWQRLAARLALADEEPREWRRLAEAMYTGYDPQTGLFEQFQGYFDLEDIDLAAYEPRTVPMDVLLGRERTQRSQVIKQADIVLLLALLWDRFPPQVRAANFQYYEPRTGHGSSLSPAVHALVAARLGDVALAERYFRQTADIDLSNTMGNAAGGVHVGALGGLWQAAVCGFAGMRLRPDGLAFDPHLPPGWRSLRFPVQWRGRSVRVAVSQEPPAVEVLLEGEQAMVLALVDGPEVVADPGRRYVVRRERHGWGPWQEVPA
ncbi:MAG: glycoside hydrolase family 65 protein [Chloroflexi bacterium]|nr:glycoside hydrolase family 65 protein [Chloroflexota bacterium]